MIPYIENVVRPGMKVVLPHMLSSGCFIWAKEEYGMRAALKAKELVNHYPWEGDSEDGE
jgi:hypothetical protein